MGSTRNCRLIYPQDRHCVKGKDTGKRKGIGRNGKADLVRLYGTRPQVRNMDNQTKQSNSRTARPHGLQPGPPFYVAIGNAQSDVQSLEAFMEEGVLIFLPLPGSRIAEEDSAAKGAYHMYSTKTFGLKWAAMTVPYLRQQALRGTQPVSPEPAHKNCQFHRGYIKAVAKVIEMAASPRNTAAGPAQIDCDLCLAINIFHRIAHVVPDGGFTNYLVQ